jgi:ABC-type transport system involved in multi-copper enzyme maturation permease subunit
MFVEKLQLIIIILGRDLRQIHRNGLTRLLVVSILFTIIFVVIFGMAGSLIQEIGTPSWTGDILEGDGPGGVEPLTLDLEADVYIGYAPLNVTVTPTVHDAEGDVKYKWYVDIDDERRVASKEAGPLHWTFDDPFMHTIACEVEDERGDVSDIETLQFNVIEVGSDWVQSVVLADEAEGPSPLDVQFAVYAASGVPPYSYSWDFGDGTTSREQFPVHTFEGTGEEFTVTVDVSDHNGSSTGPMEQRIELTEEEGELGVTLMDIVYGFAVTICIILVPMAFGAVYANEIKKGTIRTLLCYPVGPLDITIAKLLFALIIGLIFAFITFIIPVGGIDKSTGDFVVVFMAAFGITFVTMVIGALSALAIARVTGKMWFRPYSLALGAVLLAYLFTERMMGLLGTLFSFVSNVDPDYFVDTFGFLIAISPYHIGGEMLTAHFGGMDEFSPAMFIMPFLLIVVAGWLAMKVYPNVFEKE